MLDGLNNTDRLTIFVSVVDHCSLTRAADELGLTQPSISKHMKSLEDLLGVRLIEHGRRPIVPTEAGRTVYRFAKEVMRSLGDLKDAVAEFAGAKKGTLLIGASMTVGNYLMPAILARFKARNPGAEISLRVGVSQQVYQQVLDGDLQIGFTTGLNIPAELTSEAICRDELVLVVGPSHPLAESGLITIAQLAEQDFIHSPRGTPTFEVLQEAMRGIGIVPRLYMSMDHPEAIKRAVRAHVGVSFLYRVSVAEELAAGTLRELHVEGSYFQGAYHLIRNPTLYQSPLLRSFISFLRFEIANT